MLCDDLIHVGNITGVFGVKGWVKIFSFTQPQDNILTYLPWHLLKGQEMKKIDAINGQLHGKFIVAALPEVIDRDEASKYVGYRIYISRDQLPVIGENEYYWADLIGLHVDTDRGVYLGEVVSLIETGANDVLVVKDGLHERLIPFVIEQTIQSVDLVGKKMIVDWDPEF